MSIIQVENVTKTYKSGKGIFDISFSVDQGEVFGYLGPNGAGKTTTIRQLMGFTNVDQGRCLIRGMDTRLQAEEIQKFVGYIPGEIAFFNNMTGKQFLDFISQMRKQAKSRTAELVTRFELDVKPKISKMSKGMKQKVALTAAFMHDPEIYILDEPTSGLDPLMQKTFIELILEEKKRGKTILMSSHSFEEVERTSDRAGVIREGRLVALEDVNSLKAAQRKAFIVTVVSSGEVELLQNSNLEISRITGNQVEIIISSNYDEFIRVLTKCSVKGLDVLNQNLEQAFMKYYGREAEKNE